MSPRAERKQERGDLREAGGRPSPQAPRAEAAGPHLGQEVLAAADGAAEALDQQGLRVLEDQAGPGVAATALPWLRGGPVPRRGSRLPRAVVGALGSLFGHLGAGQASVSEADVFLFLLSVTWFGD